MPCLAAALSSRIPFGCRFDPLNMDDRVTACSCRAVFMRLSAAKGTRERHWTDGQNMRHSFGFSHVLSLRLAGRSVGEDLGSNSDSDAHNFTPASASFAKITASCILDYFRVANPFRILAVVDCDWMSQFVVSFAADIFPRASRAGTRRRWRRSGSLGRAGSNRSRRDAGCRDRTTMRRGPSGGRRDR